MSNIKEAKFCVQRVAPDDGTFHGAVDYFRIEDHTQCDWVKHKSHSQRMTKLNAFILCRLLSIDPEFEGYSFYPVDDLDI